VKYNTINIKYNTINIKYNTINIMSISVESIVTKFKPYNVFKSDKENTDHENTDHENKLIYVGNICKKTLPCKHEVYINNKSNVEIKNVEIKNIIEIAKLIGVSIETADLLLHNNNKINSKLYE
jgi:hypothetical protein